MKNKIVWITGASSGIGEAMAKELDQQGASVILSARREAELLRVQKTLTNPSTIIPLDVTISEDIQSAAEAAITAYGHVDILINNAGISQRSKVMDTSMETTRRLFEVNVFGNLAVTKAILPHMLSRNSGNIVVISSVAGKLSTPMRSTYAATKHALHVWYDALWAELSHTGIGVNIICPGYIKTDISINALAGDGSKHGVMDDNQANGLSPQQCAKQIAAAIKKNKVETFIGGKEVWGVKARRFMPALYYNIIKKMSKS